LVRFGRITALVVLIVATGVGYFLQDLKAIFIYIQKYWSIAYPSVCALFLAGFFYRRATARGALVALIAGPAWALAFTLAESAALVPAIPFLTRAGIDFLFASLILWWFRAPIGQIPPNAVIDRSFPDDVAAAMRNIPWYRSFGFWATLLVTCVIALYVRFF
jgi:hypothetical protein